MSDEFTCKIACSACKLEAAVHFSPDRPYTVTFDSAQFAEKCQSSKRLTSFSCIELDMAISVLTAPRSPRRDR